MRSLFAQGSVKRATLTIAVTALISQLFGMVREAVLAGYFGTSAEYDLILLALTVPGFVASIFYLTIPSAGIPSLQGPEFKIGTDHPESSYLNQRLPERFKFPVRTIFASKFSWLNVITLISIALLLGLFMPLIAQAVLPDADITAHDRFVFYGRLFCLLIPIKGLEAILKTFLHMQRRFFLVTAAPILFSITFICALPLLYPRLQTEAYLPIMIGASALQLIIVAIPFVMHRASLNKQSKDPVLSHDYLSFLGFVTVIEGIGALAEPMDRFLAGTYLDEGFVSAVNYANITFYSPVRIGIYSLSSAIFPKLAELASGGDTTKLRALYKRALAGVIFVVLPATLYLVLFQAEIVNLLFARGKFDARSEQITGELLAYYLWAIPPFSLFLLQSRFLFAIKAWRVQGILRIGAIIAKLGFGIVLMGFSWSMALGGGTILLSLILAIGYHAYLTARFKEEGDVMGSGLVAKATRAAALTLLAIAISFYLLDMVAPNLSGILRLIIVGLVFVVIAFMLDRRYAIVGFSRSSS